MSHHHHHPRDEAKPHVCACLGCGNRSCPNGGREPAGRERGDSVLLATLPGGASAIALADFDDPAED